jgi:hypothetical protein
MVQARGCQVYDVSQRFFCDFFLAVKDFHSVLLGCWNRLYGNKCSSGFCLVADFPLGKRKESVILPPSNIHSRMIFRSTLPDKNIPGFDNLSVGTLDAEPLADAVTAVCRAALSLFMGK